MIISTNSCVGGATLFQVGSAAFNLLVIVAVCISAIPDGEVRKIDALNVFVLTGTCSVLAYLWLIFILVVITPDVVTPMEGLITFLFFPMLVIAAYLVDIGVREIPSLHLTVGNR